MPYIVQQEGKEGVLPLLSGRSGSEACYHVPAAPSACYLQGANQPLGGAPTPPVQMGGGKQVTPGMGDASPRG